ncbi:MAG: GNAT family N-acetyltransferase [Deinococcales bacterium]
MLKDDINILILKPEDETLLEKTIPEVFDHALSQRWSAEFLADDRHHLAVALVGEALVGMASALHYVHPDKAPQMWINEVGVAPDYRRRGIAKKLLQCLLAHAKDLGCTEAWLLTEEENGAARALYHSLKGQELEKPIYINFDLT